ncbi:MAG: aldose 1-epimerase family protein [Planctomycetia bacterium]|nr:aldose 1-epimerase family protein [Planctomycetia bacterium]
MTEKITLVDVDQGVYVETYHYSSQWSSSEGSATVRATKRRLYGGKQDGVDVVEISSGRFTFVVALTRGMNILRASCDGVELKWDSPVNGPVHPQFVSLFAPNGCGWLEGFSEWVARCGLESNGAPEFSDAGVLKYPLHGRLSNLPARKVILEIDQESNEIRLTGEVLETSVFGHRFLFTSAYCIKGGAKTLQVEDRVTNLLSVSDEFELLYHINTGYPLVSPGSRFYAAFERMCPRDQNAVKELPNWDHFEAPTPGRPETCYFFELTTDAQGQSKVAMLDPSGERGVELSVNRNEFPYFILWKTQRPNGEIYVSGMEPAVNFPNTRSFEASHNRVVTLQPNESRFFHLTFTALTTGAEARASVSAIESLQQKGARKIESSPLAEWCE